MRLLALLACCFPSLALAASSPNILFLFADDLSFEAIRAFGHTDIDTPNLDRLVARGTTFTHTYNMGSWSPAVCIASRTMLITGRSVWNAQSIHAQTDAERTAGRLWPQLLAASGYRGKALKPAESAAGMAKIIEAMTAEDPGAPINVDGKPIPW